MKEKSLEQEWQEKLMKSKLPDTPITVKNLGLQEKLGNEQNFSVSRPVIEIMLLHPFQSPILLKIMTW